MFNEVEFIGVVPSEVQFLRVERPAKDGPSPKTIKRPPSPKPASPKTIKRPRSGFEMGDLVYHKNFGYCKVVGFTAKRVRVEEKNGKDHAVNLDSLHLQSHRPQGNAAELPALRPRLRASREEDERVPDSYFDALLYDEQRPWPKGRDPPSPETKR
jgi:hypothetical protein